jgi:hypothetical protein
MQSLLSQLPQTIGKEPKEKYNDELSKPYKNVN